MTGGARDADRAVRCSVVFVTPDIFVLKTVFKSLAVPTSVLHFREEMCRKSSSSGLAIRA